MSWVLAETLRAANTKPVPRVSDGTRLLSFVAYLFAVICLLPMIAVVLAAMTGGTETVGHLWQTVLPRYAANTGLLILLVALGTFAIGTGAAWLVTMTEFRGRQWLEIALALPLAFPAYVLAYGYTHILDHPGIVQASLRSLMGGGRATIGFLKSGRLAGPPQC